MHVLIGTDGSELSITAARRGAALLDHPDCVTLLTVLTEVPGDDAGGIEGSVFSADEQKQMWREENEEAAAELARTASALSVPHVEQRVEVGDVASVICSVADELGVDAIIVGAHARGTLGRLLLGSVSEHVVRHAPCPVVVVREGADAHD
jgi:nucleotide-binding universal stress UspA family protein